MCRDLAGHSPTESNALRSWAPDGEKRLVLSDPENATADESQVSSEKDFDLATPDDGRVDHSAITKGVKH
jgi:hypothetical protein